MSILGTDEYITALVYLHITVAVQPLTLTYIMRAFIILALVAAAAADVSHLKQYHQSASGADAQAEILQQEADVYPDGYKQAYQTSNGISGQEQGELKNAGREDEAIQVQGSAQWTAPDGQPIQLSYTANENGYQPQGAHLPTSPPIPEAIARALAYIAAHPPPPESAVRKY